MRFVVVVVSIFLFSTEPCYAELHPRENALINHSCVFLEDDPVPGAVRYELQCRFIGARGPGENQRALVQSKPFPAFFVENLQWAARYFWRINAYDAQGNLLMERPEHTFQVAELRAALPMVANTRVDVKTYQADRSAGGLIAIDYARAIFTRQGQPVWMLPDIAGYVQRETQVRDLKWTADNTLTFLTPDAALEIDLDANILWKTPSPCLFEKDTLTFHHDLKKTKRGTYLVLVSRRVKRALPAELAKNESIKNDKSLELIKGTYYKWTPMTLLAEFDKQGKIIWYWDSDTYLTNEDLAYKKNPNGTPIFLSHANAFSENEEGTFVYVGFRDLSRIVKINKATKKVMYSFGEKFPSGEAPTANNLFRRQHDATITPRNTLLLFNNNEAPGHPGRLSTTGIVEISDKNSGDDKGLVWHYDLDTSASNWSSGGGNVNELPNGNLLLCTGVVNKILEVNRQGEVVWDAQVLAMNRGEQEWKPFPQYRSSWLPALHYYYFFALPESKNADADKNFRLTVGNVGTDSDVYTVEWISENKVLQTDTTAVLKTGTTVQLQLKSPEMPRGLLLARITSRKTGHTKVYPFRF